MTNHTTENLTIKKLVCQISAFDSWQTHSVYLVKS